MCNRIICGFTLAFTLIFLLSTAKAQSVSNEGTEFYAVFPTHMPAGETRNGVVVVSFPAEYSIFITGKQASSGTVSVGNAAPIRFNLLQPNTVVEVKIPRAAAYINKGEENKVLTNRAIKILVDPGKPKVVVYGHIFAGRRSAASLILPKEALGQVYYAMTHDVGVTSDGGQTHVVLAAIEPDTKVFIQRDGRDLVPGGVMLKSAGDVFEFLSSDDLTGVKVFVDPLTSACKKFALFSGTTNSSITLPGVPCVNPNSAFPSSDPLYQQNYPIESWGKTYGFVPFSSVSQSGSRVRTNGNFVRVLAKDDNTKVSYNGVEVATLSAGKFYEARNPSNEPAYITSNNPIAVAQYSLSQPCAGGGDSDPDMVILNPIEYNIKNITVYSSNEGNIREQYINILIKTSAASSFKVNGVVPKEKFTALKGNTDYSYLQLNLNGYNVKNFNLSASEGFNAIAYGFGEVESYAYSAGTNLASSQSAIAESTNTKEEIKNACVNEAFRIKVTLTSPATSLSWKLEENATPQVQIITSSPAVVRNGTTYYEYYYDKAVSYPTAGSKSIIVTAQYPSIGGCSLNQQEIELIFDVFDPPQAKFKTSTNFCLNNEITFTDQSIDNGNAITSWNWNFGDGKISDLQNPTHTYTSTGTYTVNLEVKNSTSCTAISYQQTVVISAVPVAAFTVKKPDCNTSIVYFTDASTISSGNIVKWIWDFGDGSPKTERTDPSVFNYEYKTGGVFKVSLTTVGNLGCETTIVKEVDATVPFLELGEDITILKGGSLKLDITALGSNLQYKWSPSLGLDRDDVKNPIASPTEDTRYTLTITSQEGCTVTDDVLIKLVEKPVIRNTFSPNGDGVNDVWQIDYLESYPEVRVNIFNRFGVRVYASIGYMNPWDGFMNGTPLPVGTYYYVIDPKFGLPPYTGWVTILK